MNHNVVHPLFDHRPVLCIRDDGNLLLRGARPSRRLRTLQRTSSLDTGADCRRLSVRGPCSRFDPFGGACLSSALSGRPVDNLLTIRCLFSAPPPQCRHETGFFCSLRTRCNHLIDIVLQLFFERPRAVIGSDTSGLRMPRSRLLITWPDGPLSLKMPICRGLSGHGPDYSPIFAHLAPAPVSIPHYMGITCSQCGKMACFGALSGEYVIDSLISCGLRQTGLFLSFMRERDYIAVRFPPSLPVRGPAAPAWSPRGRVSVPLCR